MKVLLKLLKRNVKLFFKDKGMFFTSLITPLILLVLYATFLSNVYRDSYLSAIPEGVVVPDKIIDALVGGQLFSSLLAVSCITVAFCSNMLMVQDKVTGARNDIMMSPVSRSTVAIGYFLATLLSTFIICIVAAAACFVYLAIVGWYLSFADILVLLFDVFLLTTFGTALSSVINYFLSSQGQISAVGSIVSAGYGFVCGAYMPISSFGAGLQKTLMFLPGTYATALLRNHALGGALEEMAKLNIPTAAIEGLKDGVDCNIYFFGSAVSIPVMYAVTAGAAIVLLGAYVLINVFAKTKTK